MAFADLDIRIAARRIDISSRQKRTGYDQDSGYCTQSGKSSFTRVPPPFFCKLVTKEEQSGGTVDWPFTLKYLINKYSTPPTYAIIVFSKNVA